MVFSQFAILANLKTYENDMEYNLIIPSKIFLIFRFLIIKFNELMSLLIKNLLDFLFIFLKIMELKLIIELQECLFLF